jgi:hypothetical protein
MGSRKSKIWNAISELISSSLFGKNKSKIKYYETTVFKSSLYSLFELCM